MPRKLYDVHLTSQDREQLETFVKRNYLGCRIVAKSVSFSL